MSVPLTRPLPGGGAVSSGAVIALYLDLLEKCLTRATFDARRLRHLRACVSRVCEESIAGDLLEAGCWRGGAVTLMLGVLAALGDSTRCVYAADSFKGHPKPDGNIYHNNGPVWQSGGYFGVSRATFVENVRRYGLDSPRLKILEGRFYETIPAAAISQLSLIRIDVDGYEAVRDVLVSSYEKVSPGGYILIEDMRPPGARRAVEEYRSEHGVDEIMMPIDPESPIGVYWRRA